MRESEIHTQKWKISHTLKRVENRLHSLQNEEQELLITSRKCGLVNLDQQETDIECSYQNYITVLAKSEYFTLTEILVSSSPNQTGFILSIKGILENKGLTIRRNKPKFTEATKLMRKEKIKLMHEKNKKLREKGC